MLIEQKLKKIKNKELTEHVIEKILWISLSCWMINKLRNPTLQQHD